MTDLKINSGYEAVLPKLPKEEFEALKLSIEMEGQHYAIIVNEDLEVLDGHHRYRACRELDIEPDFEVRRFENKLLEKKFVIETNLRRRHLNKFQRAELAYPLLAIEHELAKQRLAAAGKVGRDIQLGVSSNEHIPEFAGQARDIVAKQASLSPTTFQRAVVVIEKAPEEIKQRIRNGDLSIGGGYKTVSAKTAFPDNRHHCLVLDDQEQPNFGYLNMPDLQTSDPDGTAVVVWLFKTDALRKMAEPPEVAPPWKGICSPRCIVAKSDKTKCKCKCHGEHHGFGRVARKFGISREKPAERGGVQMKRGGVV